MQALWSGPNIIFYSYINFYILCKSFWSRCTLRVSIKKKKYTLRLLLMCGVLFIDAHLDLHICISNEPSIKNDRDISR